MDFVFTEEQRMLEDTVRRFIDRDYTFERRRAILAADPGWSRDLWKSMGDLGLLALNVPSTHGGLDAGPVDTLLVMNVLGGGLTTEPYLASAVFATWLIRLGASAAQQAEYLPALAAGDAIATVAHAEPAGRGCELNRVETTATANAGSYRLNGQKAFVLHGGAADWLLVPARTAGAPDDEKGISLFLLRRDTPRLTVNSYRTLDDQHEAELWLRDVTVPTAARLGDEGAAYPALEHAGDIALAALCAEAVGAMKILLDATVEYLRTRRQFGQPIGRFQVLQHRAAEMLMHYEQAKSMSYLAAIRCTDADRGERRRALSAAKVTVGRASRFIAQQAVQLHGGMGMTDEMNISHYFRRLTAIELTLGDNDSHIERFVATMRANG
jgi:alkylation response protein AidB-like acyl-CoA dehydrogenase